ncbi:MAG: Amuc_1100 family pilus-like protein [Chthoniobacterales bacterium]
MSWFRQNRFLGGFLIVFAVLTLLALYFLFHEKSLADDEQARLESTATALNRLRAGRPFPNGANLRKTKEKVERYRDSLAALESELKTRSLPAVPLQPNEFQAQLQEAVNSLVERAAANKVKLPDHFYLGFDEYATSLPNSAAAPLLGQELQAITIVADLIVDAHVDALMSLTRTPLPEENPAATLEPEKGRGRSLGPGKTAGPKGKVAAAPVIASRPVAIGFSASPAAARKVLNGIATAKEQLFVIRTLNVKNQVDKGPPRGTAAPTATPTSASSPAGTPAPAGISFIVGAEHLDMQMKIEIINLLPAKEAR